MENINGIFLDDDIQKNATLMFKVAMCGPSRVGKTSIISSILEESQKILAGSKLSIYAEQRTDALIARQVTALQGSIRAGEFNPGALAGNQSSNKFILDLTFSEKKPWWVFGERFFNRTIRWAILDYPGAWLSSETRPAEVTEWKECEDWVNESRVLIIPVDAAVAMEASRKQEILSREHVLRIYDTKQLALKWAQGRCQAKDNGLLIIAPVKCESYFSDNGGKIGKEKELRSAVNDLYSEIISLVIDQCKDITLNIEYHPVDTIGCVEILRSIWKQNNEQSDYEDILEFSADYIVRHGQRYTPFGSGDLLLSICKHMIDSREGEGVGSWPIIGGFLNSAPQLRKELLTVINSDNRKKTMRIETIK